jgi:single-strand DNA-binding protein
MAMSKNRVDLMGNLGADPIVRHTQSGTPVCNLSVATNRRYKKKDGSPQEETTWHRVTVFGPSAVHCGEYLKKGDLVIIEGRLNNRQWLDKDGQKRYTTEVVATRVDFGPKRQPAEAPVADEEEPPIDSYSGDEGDEQEA